MLDFLAVVAMIVPASLVLLLVLEGIRDQLLRRTLPQHIPGLPAVATGYNGALNRVTWWLKSTALSMRRQDQEFQSVAEKIEDITGEHHMELKNQEYTVNASSTPGSTSPWGQAYICPKCGVKVGTNQYHSCYYQPVKPSYPSTPLISPPPPSSARGWECPKCGRVYSPSWYICSHCNNEKLKEEEGK